MIYFELIFVNCIREDLNSSFAMWLFNLSQNHLSKRLFFPSLNCLGIFVKNRLTSRSSGSDFAFLEKEMATPSSILAWRIPRTEEPGGLQSMGLQRVGHD